MTVTCTQADHALVKADPVRWRTECRRHRRWSEAGLVIAEHTCGSTLSIEVDAPPHNDNQETDR